MAKPQKPTNEFVRECLRADTTATAAEINELYRRQCEQDGTPSSTIAANDVSRIRHSLYLSGECSDDYKVLMAAKLAIEEKLKSLYDEISDLEHVQSNVEQRFNVAVELNKQKRAEHEARRAALRAGK